jgi:hypothetical protein
MRGAKMEIADAPPRKRTVWIWIISIYYVLSVGLILFVYYLHFTNRLSLVLEMEMFMDDLSKWDIALNLLISFLHLCGVIALFFLHRIAFRLFLAAIVASVLQSIWMEATKGWIQNWVMAGFLSTIMGYCISVAICLYSWRLVKRGVLR